MPSTIAFLPQKLKVLHIPLSVYPQLLHPILTLLLVRHSSTSDGDAPFVNISFTPYECSVICPTELAEEYFADPPYGAKVSQDDYVAIQVDGDDLTSSYISDTGTGDPGRRILGLTTPLALAGVSIFFVTTYYSDYVLVPHALQPLVMEVLTRNSFVFETHSGAYIPDPTSPNNVMSGSSSTTREETSDGTLQKNTMARLEEAGVVPQVMAETEMVHVGASTDTLAENPRLAIAVTQTLLRKPPPSLFSITLSPTSAPSLLLPVDILDDFPGDGELYGMADNEEDGRLVPILWDLSSLEPDTPQTGQSSAVSPSSSSAGGAGIVAGVAGRLVEGGCGVLTYLSTARAGVVLVGKVLDLEKATKAVGLANGTNDD
ncbi:hypothetical protein SAICODRAFT_6461 [Saitoella complicata NRRL Y-17804]|uniref:CASTOR ACT domain-containing protein n=1 Tax=Saitoella complicata (strain BCRC 22490 / CBS 7301 / JCM 7358 / NBRC 10748 / NRRL Y-17804) TaxID=698492 RepID=A0A0E9NR12_SAICN|nr:uncharacterized protein SAICODRAFT_6461 [Saitoella complicata NRRL Y-17804]ODQ54169.1 hypothetical protein SAICODRAFT_6461 [Saitoella complicata NRRL Y-17804]GAO52317.1 hypothetical protein G7K_6396-t1 [Saitoella complicata NRRL Y-17804]